MNNDPTVLIDEPVADFDIADVFLSRTDERGVIRYGNDVFRRLSGYDWPDLIGAPHRIVRHPDMPKCIFRLMWTALQNGQSFGGYVKNRSATGQYYWVFAVAVPIAGGYLSIRLKPSAPLFADVQAMYADLRGAERNAGRDPDEGVAVIQQSVRNMGYRDYAAFSGYALSVEMAARARALGQPVDPTLAQFERIGVLLQNLSKEVQEVVEGFEAISDSPENLNILGSQLKTRREPMQVVAQNYGMLAREIMGSINELAQALNALQDQCFVGRLEHCAGLLYGEAIREFAQNEPNAGTRGHAREVIVLKNALSTFIANAADSCARIGTEVDRFVSFGHRLRKMVSGLAVTRVVCLIEARSVDDDTTSIEEISHRLSAFQDDLTLSLDKITSTCSEMAMTVPTTLAKSVLNDLDTPRESRRLSA